MMDGSTARFASGSRYAALEIRVDTAAINRITKNIQAIPGAMRRAMPTAMNAAASETRTNLYREFAARLDLRRKSSIRDRLELRPKATSDSWSSGVRISLSRFTLGSFRDVQQTDIGVGWSTGGTNGTLTGSWVRRAFIRKGLTHYKTEERQNTPMVFRRAQRGEKGFATYGVNRAGHVVKATRAGDMVQRYSLKVLRGPSLGYVFSSDPGFQGDQEAKAGAVLEKKVQQQVDRILKQ